MFGYFAQVVPQTTETNEGIHSSKGSKLLKCETTCHAKRRLVRYKESVTVFTMRNVFCNPIRQMSEN